MKKYIIPTLTSIVLAASTYAAPKNVEQKPYVVNTIQNQLYTRNNTYNPLRATLGNKVMTKEEKLALEKKQAAKAKKRNEMYTIGGGLLLLKLLTSGGSNSGSGYSAPNQPELNNGNTTTPVGGIVVGRPNN